MNMKRLYLFVPAILFCTLAFSQHPHSRGGNPLYWALVGGMAYVGFYLIYWCLSHLTTFLRNKENNQRTQNNNEVPHIISPDVTQDSYTVEDVSHKGCNIDGYKSEGKEPSTTREQVEGVNYCRYCGRKIDYERGMYCKHCGKPID